MQLFGVNIHERPLIIAEVGINHNGDVSLAKEMIHAAKESGADVVKLQLLETSELYVEKFAKQRRIQFGDSEITLWELIEKVKITDEEYLELKDYAEKIGIPIFATPISERNVDFLVSTGVEAIKVASCDIDNIPFLRYIAKQGKAVILSIGMGTLEDIDRAVKTMIEEGVDKLVLLYCVSLYPPQPDQVYLQSIKILKQMYDIPIGYSDHTIGIHAAIAAIAFGASVIEKHFTIDRNLPGPDQPVSMEPQELKILRQAADEMWKMVGNKWKVLSHDEMEVARVARRSIVIAQPIDQGERLTREHLTFKRPGTGIAPYHLPHIIGRRVRRNMEIDEILKWEDLD